MFVAWCRLQKIRTRYLTNPEANATLESLVENEKGEKKRTATEGLLWLTRYASDTTTTSPLVAVNIQNGN